MCNSSLCQFIPKIIFWHCLISITGREFLPPPPLPILRRPPLLYWLPPLLASHFWLASLAGRVITSCVNLLHDIFLVTTKKSLSSLSTLVSEAPCCVVYVTRRQGHQRFHTDDMSFHITDTRTTHTQGGKDWLTNIISWGLHNHISEL